MKTIEIPIENRQIVELLESLALETSSRKDVISFMLSSDMMLTNSQSFDKYHDEYQKFYKQYDTAKQEFKKMYVDIIPNVLNWNLDFSDALLTVTVNEKV